MTLYDLYLDNDVEGYIVFKTLSRKRIMEIINHYYDEKLIITSESFQKRGECLTLSIDRYFYDYLELYFQIVKNKKETTIHNDLFHLSMTSPLEQMVHNQVPTILFGTTKLFQSFIMISNIRHNQIVLDIHFQNGQSYYYVENQFYKLKEKNQFSKLYKKFDLDKEG